MAVRDARYITSSLIIFAILQCNDVFGFSLAAQSLTDPVTVIEAAPESQGHWRPNRRSGIHPRELGKISEFISESEGLVRFVACGGRSFEVFIAELDRANDTERCEGDQRAPGTFVPNIGELDLLANITDATGIWMTSLEGVYSLAGNVTLVSEGGFEYDPEGSINFQFQPTDAFLSQFTEIEFIEGELFPVTISIPSDSVEFIPSDQGYLEIILSNPEFISEVTSAVVDANSQ
jgi:hypothetical protein